MVASLHPLRLASEIAEHTAAEWRAAHIDGRLAIPLSAVAVLAMNEGDATDRGQMRAGVLAWDDQQFAAYAHAQWATLALVRPELVVPALPLIDVWAREHDLTRPQRRAAKRTADAAVRAGLIELTGTQRRLEADVFGMLLTTLRSRADHQARGQFYTPAEVSDVMSRLLDRTSASLAASKGFHDPAAGTGGLLRAVASELRWAGIDPATVEWAASDPDPMAIACLAVNVCLADPSLELARQQRSEMQEVMGRLRAAHEATAMLAWLEWLLRKK
jgi:hypothetical protein